MEAILAAKRVQFQQTPVVMGALFEQMLLWIVSERQKPYAVVQVQDFLVPLFTAC